MQGGGGFALVASAVDFVCQAEASARIRLLGTTLIPIRGSRRHNRLLAVVFPPRAFKLNQRELRVAIGLRELQLGVEQARVGVDYLSSRAAANEIVGRIRKAGEA